MSTVIQHETATLTADVVVFTPTKEGLWVLLIQRAKEPFVGKWALPGGRVDQGETFLQAALRELHEETGLLRHSAVPVGVYDAPDRDPRGRYVSMAFTITASRGDRVRTADEGVRAADWVLVEDLLTDPEVLAFDHWTILSDAYRLFHS